MITQVLQYLIKHWDNVQERWEREARREMQKEKHDRIAALYCGAEGEENCRHSWNAAHPKDQITEEDQRRAMTPVGPPRHRINHDQPRP